MRIETPPTSLLPAELSRHTHWRDRLLKECPDIDDETLADTLEGLTNLTEIIAAIVRSALEDAALAEGLDLRIVDMKARHERLDTRAKRKRDLALRAMVEGRIERLQVADFTASLRQGTAGLEILDEERVPPSFWKPQPPKLDRQGLLGALRSGQRVEGAVLSAPRMQLNVRTK